MQRSLCRLSPSLIQKQKSVKAKHKKQKNCNGDTSLLTISLHPVASSKRKQKQQQNLEESPHIFEFVLLKWFL